MQTRKWTDQSGNDKYTTEVVLQKFRGELTLLDSKGDGRGEAKKPYDSGSNADWGAEDTPF